MNIVFIGMPGCGKSTIGNAAAKRLGMEFVDSDSFIEQKNGMTIPEIFAEFGENGFRKIETEAYKELSVKNNIVISTGGGCVERKQNIDELKKNGIIFFIDRSLENIFSDIDVSGRPLLKDKLEHLTELYERRNPLYNEYCDVKIENNGSMEEAVEKILCEVDKL